MKATDVKFVLVPQGALRALKAEAPMGVWGHAPPPSPEIFNIEKCRFQRFSGRAGVHSSSH